VLAGAGGRSRGHGNGLDTGEEALEKIGEQHLIANRA